jgi:hypothetical protein
MSEDGRVELDTRALDAGCRQLVTGIDRDDGLVAMKAAGVVAGRLRPMIPVLTGALLNTLRITSITHGAEGHYGGSLPYARRIDRRTNATATATAGAPSLYHQLATAMTAAEIRRL